MASARLPVLLCTAALCLAGLAAQQQREHMKKFLESVSVCHKSFSSVSNETVQYAILHDMALTDESSEDGRCFVECVMVQMGFLQSGGTFDVDKAYSNLDEFEKHLRSQGKEMNPSDLKQLLTTCSSQDGSGKCEKSYRIVKCSLSGLTSLTKMSS